MSATELRITIPGEPVAWQRTMPVPGKRPDGTLFVRPVTAKNTRRYEKVVSQLAQLAVNQARWMAHPDDRFSLVVRIWRTYEGKGGDLDNYLKALLDGFNGIVFPDDRYVRAFAVAFQPRDASNPRVEVVVRRFRKGESAAPRARKGSTKRG